MIRSKFALAVICLATALGLCQNVANAQPGRFNYAAYAQAQAMTQYLYMQQQYLYNQQVMAAQAQQQYLYNAALASQGYYGSSNYGSPAGQMVPGQGGYANPFTPTAPGFAVTNPLGSDPSFGSGYNPYNPYANPFYGSGSQLMGAADVVRAQGQYMTDAERANILRQVANQAKLKTEKEAFDLRMYIKANTPTYTQEKERAMRELVYRVQRFSTPGEISSGKALNLLLEDFRTNRKKETTIDPLPLSEAILSQLSVTKKQFGLGMLRDGKVSSWPSALQKRMTVAQRKQLDSQIENLVKDAFKGDPKATALDDVRNEIKKLRQDLVDHVNEIPTAQYMDAIRFLQELQDATRAIELGEAQAQRQFQAYIEGGRSGRTVQEVVNYMLDNGLWFAPATSNDESAYRALHSALASYSIAAKGGGE